MATFTSPSRTYRATGFTLVETLVVVAIIAALAAVALGFGVGALRANRARKTHAAMGNVLAIAAELKQKSLISPDHRLANFYWIQLHTAVAPAAPTWGGAAARPRQMSSAEFFAFLATNVTLTSTMLESLGRDHLAASSFPSTWPINPGVNYTAATGEVLVDVFEQNPEQSLALVKTPLPILNPGDAASTVPTSTFLLVSGASGYRLRTLVDSWGGEMVYRYSALQDFLNTSDTETPAPPLNTRIREKIIQDEAATRARYTTLGVTPAPTSATEYVRPAVAAYGYPQVISAGPDGKWGAFIDGSPPQHNGDTGTRDDDAKDNLYSTEWGR